jgi:penicillin-binding protein 1A
MVYLAAFRQGLDLDSAVPDEPIEVPLGANRGMKWIANYDNQFKGVIPLRQALAESRNAVTVWLAREIGVDKVNRIARDLGIRTPLHEYISTALGASEVRLLELAGAYRAMASGILAEPHVIARVTDASGEVVLYDASRATMDIGSDWPSSVELSLIQEGLRGVVRLPEGTAHALDGLDFPIQVMGKTGTTSDFRDALFVGSTYGRKGITVAVRIGFDDNRTLGEKETGSRAALPVFREIMLRLYQDRLVGPPPQFPSDIEARIDGYLAIQAEREAEEEILVDSTLPVPDRPAYQYGWESRSRLGNRSFLGVESDLERGWTWPKESPGSSGRKPSTPPATPGTESSAPDPSTRLGCHQVYEFTRTSMNADSSYRRLK